MAPETALHRGCAVALLLPLRPVFLPLHGHIAPIAVPHSAIQYHTLRVPLSRFPSDAPRTQGEHLSVGRPQSADTLTVGGGRPWVNVCSLLEERSGCVCVCACVLRRTCAPFNITYRKRCCGFPLALLWVVLPPPGSGLSARAGVAFLRNALCLPTVYPPYPHIYPPYPLPAASPSTTGAFPWSTAGRARRNPPTRRRCCATRGAAAAAAAGVRGRERMLRVLRRWLRLTRGCGSVRWNSRQPKSLPATYPPSLPATHPLYPCTHNRGPGRRRVRPPRAPAGSHPLPPTRHPRGRIRGGAGRIRVPGGGAGEGRVEPLQQPEHGVDEARRKGGLAFAFLPPR